MQRAKRNVKQILLRGYCTVKRKLLGVININQSQ